MDLRPPPLEVELELTVFGFKYTALGRLHVCPFCENKDGEKEACSLCEGTGILIRLKRAPQIFKMFSIKGGKP